MKLFKRTLKNATKAILTKEFSVGDNVLLYGDVSKDLVKHTFKIVGKKGKVFAIGRNKNLIHFKKFTRGKYKKRVIVNPFFETLPENTLNHILIANASINLNVVMPLAKEAHSKLKVNGQLIVIDHNFKQEELVALSNSIPWFEHSPDQRVLKFGKV